MNPDLQNGHRVGWTGPATSAIIPNLLESHLTIELPGAPPIISANSFKAIEAHETQIPTTGTRVSFQDVNYIVRNQANRKEKLKILCQVSGFLNPGEMVAVMGPSGSGQFIAVITSDCLTIDRLTVDLKNCSHLNDLSKLDFTLLGSNC